MATEWNSSKQSHGDGDALIPPIKPRIKVAVLMGLFAFGALVIGDMLAAAAMGAFGYWNASSGFPYFGRMALSFVFIGVISICYLQFTGRNLGYIDINPSKSSLKYGVAAAGLSLTALLAANLLSTTIGFSIPESPIQTELEYQPQLLIAFLFIVVFLNAPIEELLFRNIIQKRTREIYSPIAAIAIAAIIFASVHMLGYIAIAGVSAAIAPTILVLFGGVVFGIVYEHTGDLISVILAHALYNILQLSFIVIAIS